MTGLEEIMNMDPTDNVTTELEPRTNKFGQENRNGDL